MDLGVEVDGLDGDTASLLYGWREHGGGDGSVSSLGAADDSLVGWFNACAHH